MSRLGLVLAMLAVGSVGCAAGAAQSPPTVTSSDEIQLDRGAGRWMRGEELYTGIVEWRGLGGQLEERTVFREGRRHGTRAQFFPDGQLRHEVVYVNGRREGPSRSWWSNGTLRSESTFHDDRPSGVYRQWYRSGGRFKELHLVDGVEVGMQRAWRENGALYNNYEARDGRIYGIRRSKPCFQLTEEEVAVDR